MVATFNALKIKFERAFTLGSSVQRCSSTTTTISMGHATPYINRVNAPTICTQRKGSRESRITPWVKTYLHELVLLCATHQPRVFGEQQQRLLSLRVECRHATHDQIAKSVFEKIREVSARSLSNEISIDMLKQSVQDTVTRYELLLHSDFRDQSVSILKLQENFNEFRK